MRLRLGASTWDFIHLPEGYEDPLEAVAAIRRLHLTPELWLNWPARPTCYDRTEWAELAERLGPAPGLAFHTRNDRDRLMEEVELLALLGGRSLVVHPVALSEPAHRHERPARHPDAPLIRDLAAEARRRGVFLALENIFSRAFLDRTADVATMGDAEGGLAICVDVGHAELPHDDPAESAVRVIADFAPHLVHLHLHDVRDGKDHLPLGRGTIDYAAVAEALGEAGFEGTATLEIRADDPAGALREGIEFVRRHFGQAAELADAPDDLG
jgi:sugar phosphate isomerase/epimerase